MPFDNTYPCPPGNKRWSIIDYPIASLVYTQFAAVAGGTPTGGISIPASSFGLVSVEAAWAQGSFDGSYGVQEYITPPTLNQATPNNNVVLALFTTAGAAVTSQTLPSTAGYIRVMAVGN